MRRLEGSDKAIHGFVIGDRGEGASDCIPEVHSPSVRQKVRKYEIERRDLQLRSKRETELDDGSLDTPWGYFHQGEYSWCSSWFWGFFSISQASRVGKRLPGTLMAG